MTVIVNDLIPYVLQAIPTIIIFVFVLGKYKSMFDHQQKVLDKHEDAIDHILIRLEAMNNG